MANSFSNVFDRPFRGQSTPSVAVTPDNTCGITLQWITGLGWHYWTFEAYTDTRFSTASVATFQRKGLPISTQKVMRTGYVLRTANLTEADSQHVAGLIASVAVYWLREVDGVFQPTPVNVETDSLPVWKDALTRTEHEIAISLPQANPIRR